MGCRRRSVALLIVKTCDKFFKEWVITAGGAGQEMPFCGCHRIGRQTSSCRKDPGQTVLGDRIADIGRPSEKFCGFAFVLGYARAVEKPNGILDLGIDMAEARSRGEQFNCRNVVLWHAVATRIELGEGKLRVCIVGIGGWPEEFGSPGGIPRTRLSF